MSHSPFAMALVAGVLAGTSQLSAAADTVPKFDIERGCRAEQLAGSSIGESLASCTADEQRARDQLGPKWSSFSPADKSLCVKETRIDGSPSYVELLTCLQMSPSGRVQAQGR